MTALQNKTGITNSTVQLLPVPKKGGAQDAMYGLTDGKTPKVYTAATAQDEGTVRTFTDFLARVKGLNIKQTDEATHRANEKRCTHTVEESCPGRKVWLTLSYTGDTYTAKLTYFGFRNDWVIVSTNDEQARGRDADSRLGRNLGDLFDLPSKV